MQNSKIEKETRFKGLALSGGVAYGRVCLFNERRHQNLPRYTVKTGGDRQERERFDRALELVRKRLNRLIRDVKDRVGSAEAEIFSAQREILDDGEFHKMVYAEMANKNLNAEAALVSTLDYFEMRLLEMDDAYIKERSSDIGEVKRRLLDVMVNMNPSLQCAGEKFCQRGRSRIVVAAELTPSLTMELDADHTLGFVTERGGIASHAAILARALGVPAVSGIQDIHSLLFCGTEILVDGDRGEVVVWPVEETLKNYPKLNLQDKPELQVVEPISALKVMANLNLARDIQQVLAFKADGIGLYRTEFEFFAAGRLLTEDEQFRIYSSVLKAMKGKEVYFRLLDIGGDKTAAFLNLPKEENPSLGFRGSRFLLGRPEIFRTQARALARASQKEGVHVMYPMIVELDQFLKLKRFFAEATSDIKDQNVKQGVMFEVPSAWLQAKELLAASDFASIGTNDLVQYFFAVDRNNEYVAYDYSPDREVFWGIIRKITQAANRTKRPLSICGEMAGNPKYVARLMQEGIRTVSVSSKLIPGLRMAVKQTGAISRDRNIDKKNKRK